MIVEDALADAAFEPHWAGPLAGFRAIQLTPLVSQNKDLSVLVSTHFDSSVNPMNATRGIVASMRSRRRRRSRRQRALTAQSERDLRLRQLIGGLNELGLFMLDPAGKVVSWNKGAERNAGWEASEILGKHFSLLFEPQEREAEKSGEALRRAVTEGRIEDQVSRVRKDGSVIGRT